MNEHELWELEQAIKKRVISLASQLRLVEEIRKLRSELAHLGTEKLIKVGRLAVYCDDLRATYYGHELKLARLEFRALRVLAINKDHLVPHQRLIDAIWGVGAPVDKTSISGLVKALRRVLPANSIGTIYGEGYRINSHQLNTQKVNQ